MEATKGMDGMGAMENESVDAVLAEFLEWCGEGDLVVGGVARTRVGFLARTGVESFIGRLSAAVAAERAARRPPSQTATFAESFDGASFGGGAE